MSDLVKLLRESFVAYSPKERKVRSFRVREDIMPGDRERIADELERLEQENADLRAQIEKMKNCGNCQHARGHKYCLDGEDDNGNLKSWELRTE